MQAGLAGWTDITAAKEKAFYSRCQLVRDWLQGKGATQEWEGGVEWGGVSGRGGVVELDADRLGRASSKPSIPSDFTEEEQHKDEKTQRAAEKLSRGVSPPR